MKKGWEYKTLGEVGTFKRGGNFSKKDFIENGFPCIHYGQIHMKFGIETFKHLSSVPAEMVKPDRCAQKGDLVIAATSEDDAGSCKCTAWMGDYEAYVGGHAAIYRHTMEPKYVSYYFMSPYFQKAKLEYTHGFKVVEINPKDIAKISIPIPPLSEQKEIVEYLDSSFAKIDKLKENAAKNLEEAKALFQSALKDALEPKEGWEEKTLPDISENLDSRRIPITKGKRDSGKYPYYGASGIVDYVGDYIFDEDILLLSEDGANLLARSTPIAFSVSGKVWVNNHAHILKFKDMCTQRFVEYFFASKDISEYVTGAAQPKLSQKKMNIIPISIPSLSEQQSIVSFLDSLSEKLNTLQQNYSRICNECDALKQAILRQVFE